jgi:phosphoglycolate phosphatase
MNSAFLFDIDGTLLNVSRNFMRPLIEQLLKSLSIDPTIVYSIRYSGRTDSAIFRDLLGEFKNDAVLYKTLKHRYITALTHELAPHHITVLEGAEESIEYLTKKRVPTGLLTGNFKESAFVKLKAAGLDHYFSFGAFGCKHTNRNYLPEEAEKIYLKQSGHRIRKRNYVIIGDTPNDIKCARYFGATSVAVATGEFPRTELEKHEPDLILESLSSPEMWTSSLQF